jgi:hypothetical protein
LFFSPEYQIWPLEEVNLFAFPPVIAIAKQQSGGAKKETRLNN